MVEAHNLMQAGDFEAARASQDELGFGFKGMGFGGCNR